MFQQTMTKQHPGGQSWVFLYLPSPCARFGRSLAYPRKAAGRGHEAGHKYVRRIRRLRLFYLKRSFGPQFTSLRRNLPRPQLTASTSQNQNVDILIKHRPLTGRHGQDLLSHRTLPLAERSLYTPRLTLRNMQNQPFTRSRREIRLVRRINLVAPLHHTSHYILRLHHRPPSNGLHSPYEVLHRPLPPAPRQASRIVKRKSRRRSRRSCHGEGV